MNTMHYPRIVLSGLSGDSGKTIITCGLLVCLRNRGLNVSAFKKGPDYIDSAWLSLASGKPARNLDTFMMGFPAVKRSFLKHAVNSGINVIEGNRGLFDGLDNNGTHSTAELAKILQSPVIIVQDITKVTRTAVVSIIGCLKLGNGLKIEGVILNRAAGQRHIKIVKEAIEGETGVPVLGAVPKLSEKIILPSRHLGLVQPEELEEKSGLLGQLNIIAEDNIDISKIISIAKSSSNLEMTEQQGKIELSHSQRTAEKVKIGYFKDNSFSFYYPENLEQLAEQGAKLISISPGEPINSELLQELRDLDALYLGGGFPEINLPELAANLKLKNIIKELAEDGLPVYAECGGLMYLSNTITWKGEKYSLTGVLPIDIIMNDKPSGHGYSKAVVDEENAFFEEGTVIKGHEFHYSEITNYDPWIKTSLSVERGTGSIDKRDGLVYKNVFASYIHVHAVASPEWSRGMIKAAEKFKTYKNSKILIEE